MSSVKVSTVEEKLNECIGWYEGQAKLFANDAHMLNRCYAAIDALHFFRPHITLASLKDELEEVKAMLEIA